ncbi:MAG TPA: TetR/AcrR family transcriptional regulator [Jatrophihabitans sp.]|jgi:AcrR family transcriptional regulator|uniref:TetR/AcrR family transcriptional regulator n=1 Tax=Jatrophihabitans sp. TaxID=1932789 RepID=UPI002E0B6D24|nr:TetR/AcrR family transcriptional regulator [Jatrophihabitans sp.]
MKDNPRTQASRSAATRDALVRAARPLFAADGFAAVSTEAIVAAAGVTRGAMYHQFADKTDLFAAVFETVEAEMTARIDAAVSDAGESDPIALMKFGSGVWLDACAEPEAQRIVLVEAPAVLGWARWREIGLRYGLGLVQSLVQYAISVGRIADQPSEPLAHVLIGALDEAALFVAQSDDPSRARREVGAVLEGLMDALAVDPPT